MTSKPPPVALVVDDDREMRLSLVHLLEADGWEAHALARGGDVPDKIATMKPDVLLSDVRMPGIDGLTLLRSLNEAHRPPMVMISAHGDIPMAVEAMRGGAYSFVEKPFNPKELLLLLRRAVDQHRASQEATRLKTRLGSLSGLDRIFIGETEAAKSLRAEVIDMTDTKASVMLIGETGTGKELVARALHDLGPRSGQPFIPLNCATLRADRFEQVMLGTKSEPGALLAANGGTLFLDELAGWPEEAQALLLRTLESGETRTGANTIRPVDIRVISAALPSIETDIEEGRFRTDLFYRLNTLILRMPTLRERRGDIHALFLRFLTDYATLYEVHSPETTADDLTALLAHEWPGNVRELRNVAERRILAARRGGGSVASALERGTADTNVPETLREAVAVFESELIAKAVQAHGGRMDAVAEALGIGRRTLNEKIVKLGLNKEHLV